MPPPRQYGDSNAWLIGEPDLVLTMKRPSKIQATGFIPYQYVFLQPIFTEDTYVEAIEIRPHNRAVVHHCNAFYVDAVTRIRPSAGDQSSRPRRHRSMTERRRGSLMLSR